MCLFLASCWFCQCLVCIVVLHFTTCVQVPQKSCPDRRLQASGSHTSTLQVDGRDPFRTLNTLVSDDSPVTINKRHGFNHGFKVVRCMDFATIHCKTAGRLQSWVLDQMGVSKCGPPPLTDTRFPQSDPKGYPPNVKRRASMPNARPPLAQD